MSEELFEKMMIRMGYEFPKCLRSHVDWKFDYKDRSTGQIAKTKPFRALSIQNNTENYHHVGIIV